MFLLLFGGVIITFVYLRKNKRNYKRREEYGGKEVIELHQTEQQRQIYIPTVNTITYFEGEIPSSTIQDRLVQIVRANPWLCSRLVTVTDGSSTSFVLVHDRAESLSTQTILLDHYIEREVNNDQLPPDQQIYIGCSMESICSKFQSLFVKRGVEMHDQPEEVMFRVIVVKIVEKQKVVRTAFLMSMGHVLIDGHSFYQIYNMFDHKAAIHSYNPQRILDFPQRMIAITGKAMQDYLKSIIFILAAMFWKYCFPPRKHTLLFRIDANKIEHIKQTRQANTTAACSFISTNDILTSAFFKAVQASYGLMPMNYRNRLDGITSDHIGNYQSNMLFPPEIYNQPEAIREMITRYDIKKTRIPTLWETLQFRVAMVTNWSTFAREIAMTPSRPGLYHSPLQPVITVDALILFRSKAQELSAYIMCDQSLTKEYWLRQCPFFSEMK